MVGCDSGGDPGVEPETPDLNVAQYLQQDQDFSTLASAVEAAGLGESLSGSGPFTVFAPANGAFESVNTSALTSDTDLLTRVLNAHVVAEDIAVEDIEDGQTVQTVQGAQLNFSVDENGDISVNGAPLTGRSVNAANGRVHRLGGILLGVANVAERAKITPSTSALSSVLTDDLVGTLEGSGPFTVFAPVDGAVNALNTDVLTGNSTLLSSILSYHVVEGSEIQSGGIEDGQTVSRSQGADLTFSVGDDGSVTVNEATVTTADVQTSNGVIHLVDKVMLEPTNIAQRAQLTPALDSLTAGLQSAGLASTLGQSGPFTVFAPVNSAFGAVDYDELAGNASLLSRVLEYHVVSGQSIQSGDIMDGQTVTTVDGTELLFTKTEDGTLLVNGREVISSPDLSSTNGTVHVVDGVLLGSANLAQRAALTPATSTLTRLVQEAGLAGSSGLGDESGGKYTVFAPTNAAFAKIDTSRFNDDTSLRDKTLKYHVLDGELRAEDMQDGQMEQTLEGSDVVLNTFADANPQVNGVDVAVTNVKARNGIIHVVNTPLLEASTVGERIDLMPSYSTLAAKLRETDRRELLDETGTMNSPFTVFAPTNEALAAAQVDTMSAERLGTVLDYHLVTGASLASDDIQNGQEVQTSEGADVTFQVGNDGSVTINGNATVTAPDLQSRKNGVVHGIDSVLLPPSDN